jgi:hypothetical protein
LEDDASALRIELKSALGRIESLEKTLDALQAPKAAPASAPARRGNWQ